MKKKSSKKNNSTVPMIIFIVGILVLTYPFYSQAFNNLYDSYNVSKYQKKHARDFKKERQKQEEANKEMGENGINAGYDPFSNTDQVVAWNDEMFNEHFIGNVIVPKIDLSVPLFDETNMALLDRGATVLNGTSQPLGETDSHSVITAHRGLPNRELFTNVVKLVEDDIFIIESYGETLAYSVREILVVEPHETDVIVIAPGEDLVTLVTCTPYMINSHRLLITGERVYDYENIEEVVKTTKQSKNFKNGAILGAIVVGVSGSLGFLVMMKRKDPKQSTPTK